MKYLELIDEYKDQMINTLSELVSIRSVVSGSVQDKKAGFLPFGEGVQKAFDYLLERGAKDGFDTVNVDNYGGHIEFGGYTLDEDGEIIGTSDEIMGIVGHLDVVPEGTGWSTDPYSGAVIDNRVYGRGTADDKGPVIAAYYAMKALKDSGFVPAKKVRLVIGLDEETNWHGMDYYLKKEKAPNFGFTPDADFPAIHGEKGIVIFHLAKKMGKSIEKGLELRSFKGGSAANMVADSARVVLRDDKTGNYDHIKELVAEYRNQTKHKINVKGVGKSLEITTSGVSAHGATPEKGINAISVMMEFLGKLSFANDDFNDFIDFYNKHVGFELDGTSLGCGLQDEPSGKLVLNTGIIDMDQKAAKLTINVRYPVTCTEDQVYDGIMPIVNKYNLGVIKEKQQAPIYMPEDDPLIVTLMNIYKKHTGDVTSKPLVIGGGTYARACPGIIAFGCIFPGEKELAHQKDEYIDIDSLTLSAKIFADAIYELTKEA